jgi:hypothetical protein
MGKYVDSEGQEKTRWQNCGVIIKTESGRVVLKLDALPVNPAPSTDGQGGLWLQCFENDRNEGRPPQVSGQPRPDQMGGTPAMPQQPTYPQGGYQGGSAPPAAQPAAQPADPFKNDIPF